MWSHSKFDFKVTLHAQKGTLEMLKLMLTPSELQTFDANHT